MVVTDRSASVMIQMRSVSELVGREHARALAHGAQVLKLVVNSKHTRIQVHMTNAADGNAQSRTGAAPARLMVSTHRAMVTTARCTDVAG
jgi:hypothetical protein